MELLVGSSGLAPSVADFHGRTALHLAAANAHLPIVQLLIAQPARRGVTTSASIKKIECNFCGLP